MLNSPADILDGIISLIVGTCFIIFREKIMDYVATLERQKNNKELSEERKLFVRIFIFVFSLAALAIGSFQIYRTIATP
jgi:hypothetical protein